MAPSRSVVPCGLATLAGFWLLALPGVQALHVCPGDTRDDFKCNHDKTHRVCAVLAEGHGSEKQPLKWGQKNFWEITGQTDAMWLKDIGSKPENPGDGWCICMWATAELIESVGCDNVHIDCDATDVEYILPRYEDGGHDLTAAHKCLEKKCGESSLLQGIARHEAHSSLRRQASETSRL